MSISAATSKVEIGTADPIRAVSIRTPSVREWPAKLCPPPRIANGMPVSRASLAFAADFRILVDSAGYNTSFAGVALSCDTGSSWTLPRLVGRAKEMYVRGGYNVYPMEVEAVLASHPGIAQAAVGVREDRLVAWLVPRDGQTPDAAGQVGESYGENTAADQMQQFEAGSSGPSSVFSASEVWPATNT